MITLKQFVLILGRFLGRTTVIAFLIVSLFGLTASTAFADPTVYTVQAGDTLYRIAARYGKTVNEIVRANALRNAALVYSGQQIIIPDDTTEKGSYLTTTTPRSQPVYVVQPGDTLVGIAFRFGMTARELADLNQLEQWDLIFAGQRLKVLGVAVGVKEYPIAPGPKRIEIDVSEQRMRVYEADRLIWDWPASTGLPGYPTRYGRFQVLDKIPMAYSRPWALWMPHWLGIYWAGGSENGIHSLPIINGRKLWAGYLGSKISYGCVVIGTEEGEKLFNWADIGTTVEILE
ncbi:MAG: LysM peptidoglycan-binding domain-containing protein [Anaerolineae bacterium]